MQSLTVSFISVHKILHAIVFDAVNALQLIKSNTYAVAYLNVVLCSQSQWAD